MFAWNTVHASHCGSSARDMSDAAYHRRRHHIHRSYGTQRTAKQFEVYLLRRRQLLCTKRAPPEAANQTMSETAANVSESDSPAQAVNKEEAEMQRKLREKKQKKLQQVQQKEKLRKKQLEEAKASGKPLPVVGSTLEEQIGNALTAPQPRNDNTKQSSELAALEPGSDAAGKVLAKAADEAPAQATVDEGLYWSMRDCDGGYALYGSRRLFHFLETPVTMLCFARGHSWLLAIAMSNFSISIAHVSERNARIVSTCAGHSGQITALTWSHNNEMLCSSSSDHTIHLWANPEFQCVGIIDCGATINSVCFHPTQHNLLAMCDSNRNTQLIDTSTGESVGFICIELTRLLTGAAIEEIEFDDAVRALAFTPDGKMLLCGAEDGYVRTISLNDCSMCYSLILWQVHAYFYYGKRANMKKVSTYSCVDVELLCVSGV